VAEIFIYRTLKKKDSSKLEQKLALIEAASFFTFFHAKKIERKAGNSSKLF
jgi:hypothetical protein